jgi:hypothetical protein
MTASRHGDQLSHSSSLFNSLTRDAQVCGNLSNGQSASVLFDQSTLSLNAANKCRRQRLGFLKVVQKLARCGLARSAQTAVETSVRKSTNENRQVRGRRGRIDCGILGQGTKLQHRLNGAHHQRSHQGGFVLYYISNPFQPLGQFVGGCVPNRRIRFRTASGLTLLAIHRFPNYHTLLQGD